MRGQGQQRDDAISTSESQGGGGCGDDGIDSDLIQMRFRGYLAMARATEARPAPRLWWRTKKNDPTTENAKLSCNIQTDNAGTTMNVTREVEISKLTDEWSRCYLLLSDNSSSAQKPPPKTARRQQVWPRTCFQSTPDHSSAPVHVDAEPPQQAPDVVMAADEWAACFLSLIE